jgi:hypothetical protein
MKRIRVFKKSEDKFHLHEVRNLYYSGDLLLECNCYLPEIIQDSLYLDCSTQYEYNIMGDVVHESNFNDGSLFEKFYTYEDSCGNFKSTIGAICCFHNFPLKLPISPK